MRAQHRCLFVSILATVLLAPVWAGSADAQQVLSEISSTESGDRILRQELVVSASVDAAWSAFTTEAGLRGWAVPLVEVDFRPGGSYRSHYDPAATIGDPGTITVTYLNYIPRRLLTMQAEIPEQFPQFIRDARDRLFNIVEFVPVDDTTTMLVSWGLGYGGTAEWDGFLDFFVQANAATYRNLIRYFEDGPLDWSAN